MGYVTRPVRFWVLFTGGSTKTPLLALIGHYTSRWYIYILSTLHNRGSSYPLWCEQARGCTKVCSKSNMSPVGLHLWKSAQHCQDTNVARKETESETNSGLQNCTWPLLLPSWCFLCCTGCIQLEWQNTTPCYALMPVPITTSTHLCKWCESIELPWGAAGMCHGAFIYSKN